MILTKQHELYFETNDIYKLESFSDKIIVNDDYQGIMIHDFDKNLIIFVDLKTFNHHIVELSKELEGYYFDYKGLCKNKLGV